MIIVTVLAAGIYYKVQVTPGDQDSWLEPLTVDWNPSLPDHVILSVARVIGHQKLV